MKQFISLLVLILIVSLSINAQNLVSIELTTTFHNIGIDVKFDAATPAGASIAVAVAQRSASQVFRNAHPLSRIADNRFAGSVFQVKSNTEYSIRLSSALFSADQYDTVLTRSEAFPQATGTVYHISPAGSDGNTGLSFAQAFTSLKKAVSVAQAGNTIMLHAGRYYEEVTLPRSGSSDAPVVIRNAPGERAMLDGRDTSFSPAWKPHAALPGVYKTPYAFVCCLVYHNGRHLFRYQDLNALGTNTWNLPGAFYSSGDTLFVRFPGNGAPTGKDTITVPAYTTAITNEKDYIHIIGLEIRYYGRGEYSRGLYINNASYNLIDSCFFHHSNTGIGMKRASHYNTIQHCTFNDSPVETWSWQAVKEGTGYYESGAIVVYSSDQINTGNVIRFNHISNKFDGAQTGSDDAPTTNMDFYNNTIEYIGDDAISCDGAGINNRFYNNTLRSFLVGISVAPAAIGPHYIFRNLLCSWRSNSGYDGYPIKLNVTSSLSTNWVYLYHNTCFTNVPAQDGFVFKQYSDWHNVISRNNCYSGTGYALNSWADQNPVDFDYDNFYTAHTANFITWKGTKYSTLAAFSAATSQESHGISYCPEFIDTQAGDYHLKQTSSLIDKGVIIPGINDSFYNSAPDVGCFEYTGTISIKPHISPKNSKTLFCYRNPGNGSITIALPDLMVKENIVAAVYNIKGQEVYKRKVNSPKKSIVWQIKNYNPGKYIVVLKHRGDVYMQEIVLMK